MKGELMTWTQTRNVAEQIVRCLQLPDYPALLDLYADDVLLDFELPTYHLQLHGISSARKHFDQTAKLNNVRCTHLRHVVADDVVVVESEARFDSADGESMWRSVDWFDITAGKITTHTQHCTGYWPPSGVNRLGDSPIVRPDKTELKRRDRVRDRPVV
jgi:ketosteroid isomerase-like protein